jgi:hypothetical protein
MILTEDIFRDEILFVFVMMFRFMDFALRILKVNGVVGT